jgi:hypothetical protein
MGHTFVSTITVHCLPGGLIAYIALVSPINEIKYVALRKQGWVVLYADGRGCLGKGNSGVYQVHLSSIPGIRSSGGILSVKMSMVKSDCFWIAFGNGDIYCSVEERIYKIWVERVAELKQ